MLITKFIMLIILVKLAAANGIKLFGCDIVPFVVVCFFTDLILYAVGRRIS